MLEGSYFNNFVFLEVLGDKNGCFLTVKYDTFLTFWDIILQFFVFKKKKKNKYFM